MSDVKNILVTGGAGFIGSHTCVELLQAGYGVVIIDDLSNSCEKPVNRIAQIVKQAEADGKAPAGASERMKFYADNVLNRDALERIFAENDIYGVIHFAGFKAVGESGRKATRVLLQQSHQHAHSVRRYAQAWLQAHCVQLERHGVWRAR